MNKKPKYKELTEKQIIKKYSKNIIYVNQFQSGNNIPIEDTDNDYYKLKNKKTYVGYNDEYDKYYE